MPIIYLKHAVHGTKIATLEAEAIADEKRGWQRFDPKAVVPTPNPLAAVAVIDIAVKNKGGRPRKVVQ